ncbi:FadR family transcriptional regulator [Amycolatopsis rubida]|uniref:DNA-binding transcriptional regulator, FadR family n=1 Tax=Amycolatopsis rubida TaxID=112413 RepID=A0A1I5PNV0_9PSEU|nr:MULTISPECIES: FCD domain-containing protein [Amycolatopsis]MYW92614.1 FCD domain-containing protein [Amycolatopsis rubida]NEC57599.1 FadR family transcriptional regulator [Amycolatopsis rubida]OAP26253.1 putative L-lactate dehydrogenase operon regulatory protein [Amycolatopsis sp. M39]SFP35832.1 DNA-binding transcriptional regulator, FadR family [Amycolatopsis rubida]
MTVRSVRRTSLVDAATAELRRLIGEGEWPVGAKLPNEVELSKLLGVGRSTAREAVRALISAGQLYSQQGSGTYVASETALSDLDRKLRTAQAIDVYEVRVALEVEAGILAATRRTAADLEALRAALAARDRAGSLPELLDADLAFHRAVVLAAHNPVLIDVFDSFLDAMRAVAGSITTLDAAGTDTDDLHRSHHDLVAAIDAGDPDAAARATRRNVGHTLTRLR